MLLEKLINAQVCRVQAILTRMYGDGDTRINQIISDLTAQAREEKCVDCFKAY